MGGANDRFALFTGPAYTDRLPSSISTRIVTLSSGFDGRTLVGDCGVVEDGFVVEVRCRVVDAGELKRFPSLVARAACPTVNVSALVTGPGIGDRNAEPGGLLRDPGLVVVDERADESRDGAKFVLCPGGSDLEGLAERRHELRTAIRI